MEKFEITGFQHADRSDRDLAPFTKISFEISLAGEVESTFNNIQGALRVDIPWSASPAEMTADAKARVAAFLRRAADDLDPT